MDCATSERAVASYGADQDVSLIDSDATRAICRTRSFWSHGDRGRNTLELHLEVETRFRRLNLWPRYTYLRVSDVDRYSFTDSAKPTAIQPRGR